MRRALFPVALFLTACLVLFTRLGSGSGDLRGDLQDVGPQTLQSSTTDPVTSPAFGGPALGQLAGAEQPQEFGGGVGTSLLVGLKRNEVALESEVVPGPGYHFARITGRLQLPDGTPLSGLTVEALHSHQGSASFPEASYLVGLSKTWGDGRFQFLGLRKGQRYDIRLGLDHELSSVDRPETVTAPALNVVVNVDGLLVRGFWADVSDAPEAGLSVPAFIHALGPEGFAVSTATEYLEVQEGGFTERLLPSDYGYVLALNPGERQLLTLSVPIGSTPGLFVKTLEARSCGLGVARFVIDGVLPPGGRLQVHVAADSESSAFPAAPLEATGHVQGGASECSIAGLLPGRYKVSARMRGGAPHGYLVPELDLSAVTIEAGRVSEIAVRLVRAGHVEVIVEPPAEHSKTLDTFRLEFRRAGDLTWSTFSSWKSGGGPPRREAAVHEVRVGSDLLQAGPITLRARSEGWTSAEVPADVLVGETIRCRIAVKPMD